jgi:hypothetical protein
MLKGLKAWWNSPARKALVDVLVVEFDDAEVRVSVLADLEAEWNQTFQWRNITRVCFEDGGMTSSDVVYVSLNDRQKPAVVPTDARGGHDFFGALCDRGYFPESVWRRAVGDTGGGLHCWPPTDG